MSYNFANKCFLKYQEQNITIYYRLNILIGLLFVDHLYLVFSWNYFYEWIYLSSNFCL